MRLNFSPDETQKARLRLGYVTPAKARKVSSKEIYWSVPFLGLYLSRCDEVAFDQPQDGYELGRWAPKLAGLIRVGDQPGEFEDERERASYRVYALAVCGSCCRAANRMAEAEAAFEEAFALCRSAGQIHVKAVAELYRRFSVLRIAGQHDDALGYVEKALELYDRIDDRAGCAQALVIRGIYRFHRQEPCTVDFAHALQLSADDRSVMGRLAADSALQNLAMAASRDTAQVCDHDTACALVRQIQRRFGNRRKSLRKMHLFWIEGMLLANLGILKHAARRMLKARAGLRSIDQPIEYAIVSLDLACLYAAHWGADKVRELAEETHATLEDWVQDPRVFEILEPWRRSLPVEWGRLKQQLQGLQRN